MKFKIEKIPFEHFSKVQELMNAIADGWPQPERAEVTVSVQKNVQNQDFFRFEIRDTITSQSVTLDLSTVERDVDARRIAYTAFQGLANPRSGMGLLN